MHAYANNTHTHTHTHTRTCTQVNSKVVVDCSHGNSNKLHSNQPKVAADIAAQIAGGSTKIFGVMIESNIEEGNQAEPLKVCVCVREGDRRGECKCMDAANIVPRIYVMQHATASPAVCLGRVHST